MCTYLSALRRFVGNEDGPTSVEYAVMLALILLVCIVSIRSFGQTVSGSFSHTASVMP
jgi:pilus assembly protein Flp/PilA